MDRLLASASAAVEATATAKGVQPHYASIGSHRGELIDNRLPTMRRPDTQSIDTPPALNFPAAYILLMVAFPAHFIWGPNFLINWVFAPIFFQREKF